MIYRFGLFSKVLGFQKGNKSTTRWRLDGHGLDGDDETSFLLFLAEMPDEMAPAGDISVTLTTEEF